MVVKKWFQHRGQDFNQGVERDKGVWHKETHCRIYNEKLVPIAGVSKMLKRIATTGSVARKPRNRALRTQINISAVEELVLSQDDQPCTHLSNRETARAIGMSKSSVHNTVKKPSCDQHILRTGVL